MWFATDLSLTEEILENLGWTSAKKLFKLNFVQPEAKGWAFSGSSQLSSSCVSVV